MSKQLGVAICTKGRSACVRDAVASVLADPDPSIQLVVVDQNDDDRVVDVLQDFHCDPRLMHVRIDSVGAGRARNVALSRLESDVVCFTDDDCTIPVGWVQGMTDIIRQQPDLGLLYCAVTAPPGGSEDGYTPIHDVPAPKRHTRWDSSTRADNLGLGAGMAARRTDLLAIGGFDPLMGPGAEFPSADDREIAYRLLLSGKEVWHTPDLHVLHHGHRAEGVDARQLTKRDHLALGAMYAKLFHVNRLRATGHLGLFLVSLLRSMAETSVRLRRPAGIGKIRWTLVGLWRGLRSPLDRVSLTFHDNVEPSKIEVIAQPG